MAPTTTPDALRPLEKAFQRHQRPQQAALIRAIPRLPVKPYITSSTPMSTLEIEASQNVLLHQEKPWLHLRRIGELVQGRDRWLLCETRTGAISMLKQMSEDRGRAEFALLSTLHHPSILHVDDSFCYNSQFYLGYEYCRFTLEEVLCVPIKLGEDHIRYIAISIIAALEYMADHGIVHHRIDCQSIRVCGKSGKVFLSDFEKATLYRRQSLPNTDFEALGLVLIRTMNKNHLGQLDVNSVREQRRENKLYGIHDAEYWSHCKSLIDFLDDLFIN
ncbi:hypothetical protein EG328_004118 [Venturia inaequalis]|uniref:Protein kinase domain-containing protein n=1 Tax=Venturia inaequalis TaxID=5025 RepID=A0A8H3VEF7_VENIN|nr:hypothetical protein EG328_004118 [Venturia inaequalis]